MKANTKKYFSRTENLMNALKFVVLQIDIVLHSLQAGNSFIYRGKFESLDCQIFEGIRKCRASLPSSEQATLKQINSFFAIYKGILPAATEMCEYLVENYADYYESYFAVLKESLTDTDDLYYHMMNYDPSELGTFESIEIRD